MHNSLSQTVALQIRAGAGAAERPDQRAALAAGADAGHAQARRQERQQVNICTFVSFHNLSAGAIAACPGMKGGAMMKKGSWSACADQKFACSHG